MEQMACKGCYDWQLVRRLRWQRHGVHYAVGDAHQAYKDVADYVASAPLTAAAPKSSAVLTAS